MELQLIRKDLKVFTKIIQPYTQILYLSSNIYIPSLIHHNPNVSTKIVRSYDLSKYF